MKPKDVWTHDDKSRIPMSKLWIFFQRRADDDYGWYKVSLLAQKSIQSERYASSTNMLVFAVSALSIQLMLNVHHSNIDRILGNLAHIFVIRWHWTSMIIFYVHVLFVFVRFFHAYNMQFKHAQMWTNLRLRYLVNRIVYKIFKMNNKISCFFSLKCLTFFESNIAHCNFRSNLTRTNTRKCTVHFLINFQVYLHVLLLWCYLISCDIRINKCTVLSALNQVKSRSCVTEKV